MDFASLALYGARERARQRGSESEREEEMGEEEEEEEKKMERQRMRSGRVEEEQMQRSESGREAVGEWIIRKAQLKDNFYFINAPKLHYCSHTQSHCPHSRLRPECVCVCMTMN